MSDEEKRPETEETEAAAAAESSASESSDAAESSAAAESSEASESSEAAESSEASESSEAAEASEASESSAGAAEDHGHDEGGHHGPHIATRPLLLGVAGALLILTILTVAVTGVDLGSQGNFVVAMIIATIKAALVMAYFMHLAWDKKFNVVVFTSSFLFVVLFLSMALLDRSEYQPSIDTFQAENPEYVKQISESAESAH